MDKEAPLTPIFGRHVPAYIPCKFGPQLLLGSTHLLGSQVPLGLSQHLVPNHELADSGGAQQWWVVVSMQLPVVAVSIQVWSCRSPCGSHEVVRGRCPKAGRQMLVPRCARRTTADSAAGREGLAPQNRWARLDRDSEQEAGHWHSAT